MWEPTLRPGLGVGPDRRPLANGDDSYDTIGISGGSVDLYGVDAVSPAEVNVAGGDGSIFRYIGAVWTKLAVTGSALAGIDRDGEDGLACGGSGTILERRE